MSEIRHPVFHGIAIRLGHRVTTRHSNGRGGDFGAGVVIEISWNPINNEPWIHTDAGRTLIVQESDILTVNGWDGEPCKATISHGPGHQSQTNCDVHRVHTVHHAIYGEFERDAYWKGDSTSSGYFDSWADEQGGLEAEFYQEARA